MLVEQNKIAIVFDFDDTLTEDTLTRLLSQYGVDVDAFWLEDVASLSEEGWDPPLGYMKAMLDLTKNNGALSLLKNRDLFEFGQTLDFYEGVREFLDQIPAYLGSRPDWSEAGVSVEFYIVTGGLQEIVDGCPIRDSFRDVWGCSFQGDASTGVISLPKNSMTFTDKTRFLFQINKGIVGPDSRKNPNAVNKDVPPEERPIPFHNMIYIGDGLTDIPCFSLVENGNGVGFGIFHPDHPEVDRRKKIAWNLMEERRVASIYSPKYGQGSDLRFAIELALESICRKIVLRRQL